MLVTITSKRFPNVSVRYETYGAKGQRTKVTAMNNGKDDWTVISDLPLATEIKRYMEDSPNYEWALTEYPSYAVSRETKPREIYTLQVNGTPIPAKGTFVYKCKGNSSFMRCDHGYPINADVYHDGQWAFAISVDAMLGTMPHSCPTKEWMTTLNHLIEVGYFAPPQESDDTEYVLDLECPDDSDDSDESDGYQAASEYLGNLLK